MRQKKLVVIKSHSLGLFGNGGIIKGNRHPEVHSQTFIHSIYQVSLIIYCISCNGTVCIFCKTANVQTPIIKGHKGITDDSVKAGYLVGRDRMPTRIIVIIFNGFHGKTHCLGKLLRI